MFIIDRPIEVINLETFAKKSDGQKENIIYIYPKDDNSGKLEINQSNLNELSKKLTNFL